MTKALYQSFDNQSDPDQGPERLNTLRQEIAARDLTGYLVPRADVHQGEYVAARDERLAWLTGFTGSAGFCAVLPTCAGVFVDGRYRVQVKTQVRDVFTPVDWPEVKVPDWLRGNVTEGTIGFDPWLHTLSEIEGYSKALDGSGITLSPCENLIDLIWPDQPDAPMAKAFAYEEKYAGKTHLQKRQDIARVLKDAGQDAAVITLPDSLAWLLNMRGGDVSHVPIAHGFVILHSDASADLFMAADKLSQIGDHLGPDIRLHAPESFGAYLSTLTGRVRIDPDNVPMAVASILTTSGIATQRAQDPTILPKACKNSVELMQARGAHLRDAAAMCEFLCWLDAQAIGTLSEIDVAVALEGFRRADPALTDISFDTISASGPNAALPHYSVTKASNRQLKEGEVMLVDSGGQYLDGTTDITRTIAVGAQPDAVKRAFTRVLQGMIAISRLRFPAGIAGRDLDGFARAALWAAGQDFNHGTGHGVGQFLSVHEGPQRLSRQSTIALDAGMILSNEPGFYQEGQFGIRTENLLVVQPAQVPEEGNIKTLYEFETLTYVPIDLRMVVSEMLSEPERIWLNSYHQNCREKISHRLSDNSRLWLEQATRPV